LFRRAMISLLCALSALGCASSAFAAPPVRDREGVVHFAKSADSSFDRFSYAPSAARQQWMRDKYWRMRAYSPYFDSRTAWYERAWFYKDAYAIYPGERLDERWFLRDAQGRKLYIWYGCGGGTCPQYAADIGNPQFRAHWIADARRSYEAGYKGIFVDDVNMELRISDGNGKLQWPHDPRTGTTMTEQSWRRYMAEFMEQIRRAFPAAEIVHNSLWFDGDDDPYIKRQLAAADLIEIERGINDSGLRGGEGVVSLRTLLKFIDRRHAAGQGVILDASADTAAGRMYGLAGYFLVSEGRDALGNDPWGTPEDWWPGYDTDLGSALGKRYDLPNGVIRRDFTRGTVLLNTPDEPTRTVELGPGYTDLDGRARRSVTLGPASGIVLRRTAAPTETTIEPPTSTTPPPTPTTPPPTSTTPPPTPTATPPAATPAPAPAATPRRRSGSTARVARVDGRRVRITGRVAGATKGRVDLVVQRKRAKRWKTVRRVSAKVARDGRFARTIRTHSGRHRVQARFRGTTTAAASASSFRLFSAK